MRNKTDDDYIVLEPELKSEWGIPYSKTHRNRLITKGAFPPPIILNPLASNHGSRKGWWASALRAYLRSLKVASSEEAA